MFKPKEKVKTIKKNYAKHIRRIKRKKKYKNNCKKKAVQF